MWSDSGPKQVESVLLSTQHHPMWNDRQGDLRDLVVQFVIMPALGDWWNDDVKVLFSPTGRFETGGPEGDTGLTGRKIIVDTYGGWASTAAAPSPARTARRLTDQRRTWPAIRRRTS